MLTARRARALNNVVLAITGFSLAAFGVTAWEFVQKRFDPFDLVSLLVSWGPRLVHPCHLGGLVAQQPPGPPVQRVPAFRFIDASVAAL